MELTIKNVTYKFAEQLTGEDLLNLDEPEGLMILDKAGMVKKFDDMTDSEKKTVKRSQKLLQYQILGALLISPKMTIEQILKTDVKILNQLIQAIKPILGE